MIDRFRKRSVWLGRWAGLVLASAALLQACGSAAGVPMVDLSERAPLPASEESDAELLRVGVASILTPEGNVASYGDFAVYLSNSLNRPVSLVQRRTYAEINALLEAGDVDIAFVCTSAYVRGHDDFGLTLLAAPEIDGATVYHSEVIVPAISDATTIEDLEGAVFAFTDPMSTTGRFYPTHLVGSLGHDPDTFFADTFFTYSHEDAINAVANGVADGAAVDSLVLAFVSAREPDLSVRVIHRSPPFAIPPVVASPHVSEAEAAEIQDLLLALGSSVEDDAVLEAMGVDRFVRIADGAYGSVRALIDAVEEP